MDVTELVRQLHGIGCKIVRTQLNREGTTVYLITHESGWNVAMFHQDAADLVSCRASIDDIIAGSKGADLADPWPIIEPADQ